MNDLRTDIDRLFEQRPTGRQGDVAENRDFISLSHEMEIPMAEIARHVGDVDQLSLRQFEKWSQQIGFMDFIDVPHSLLTPELQRSSFQKLLLEQTC